MPDARGSRLRDHPHHIERPGRDGVAHRDRSPFLNTPGLRLTLRVKVSCTQAYGRLLTRAQGLALFGREQGPAPPTRVRLAALVGEHTMTGVRIARRRAAEFLQPADTVRAPVNKCVPLPGPPNPCWLESAAQQQSGARVRAPPFRRV